MFCIFLKLGLTYVGMSSWGLLECTKCKLQPFFLLRMPDLLLQVSEEYSRHQNSFSAITLGTQIIMHMKMKMTLHMQLWANDTKNSFFIYLKIKLRALFQILLRSMEYIPYLFISPYKIKSKCHLLNKSIGNNV